MWIYMDDSPIQSSIEFGDFHGNPRCCKHFLALPGSASICSRMRKPQPESWTEATMSMTKRRANLKTSWWEELGKGWWVSYDFCFPCWSSTSWCVLDHFGGGEPLLDLFWSILEMSRWPRLRSRHVQNSGLKGPTFGGDEIRSHLVTTFKRAE